MTELATAVEATQVTRHARYGWSDALEQQLTDGVELSPFIQKWMNWEPTAAWRAKHPKLATHIFGSYRNGIYFTNLKKCRVHSLDIIRYLLKDKSIRIDPNLLPFVHEVGKMLFTNSGSSRYYSDIEVTVAKLKNIFGTSIVINWEHLATIWPNVEKNVDAYFEHIRKISVPKKEFSIHGYHDVNPINFFNVKLKPNVLYYGLEVEVRTIQRAEAEKQYQKQYGKLVCQNDSGTEFITIPLPYDEMRQFIMNFDVDGRTTADNGVHIHVSNKLEKEQLANIIRFVNNRANERYITAVCGRYNNNYCKINHELVKKPTTTLIKDYDNDRYSAVNLTNRNCNGKNTVEFRLFGGTTERATLMGYLEFVDSLINFYKEPTHKDVTMTQYSKWLTGRNYAVIPHIANAIKNSNILA